jgi:hypothetical protein
MVVEFAATDANGVLRGSKSTNVLVDSGADLTMLNADLAADLGLDISGMRTETLIGIGGSTTGYFPNPADTFVFANLCGQWTVIPICFEVNRDTNLLGRAGAFEALNIAFVHSQSWMFAARV